MIGKELLLLLLLFFSINAKSQIEQDLPSHPPAEQNPEKEVFSVVEEAPEFPGGNDSLFQFIVRKLRYPEPAKKNGVEGIVVVSFIVSSDSTLKNITIIKPLTPETDAEVIRVINLMPKWNPGRQRGKNVSVRLNLPVRFKL